ncbi:unnamed protein product [Heligmosomoides polygyrus]|uniref:EF-hand domain-containing protein n=1 Tax=Heligmosomoides polygyrus TaxID=6339 RepID=A0A183GUG5_HELPZ|nr:unnamed protein product [Heligmosomoides polygyrus]
MALQALFHNRRQEELRDFKLKDVFDKLNMDAADFQEWLRRMGLLATESGVCLTGCKQPEIERSGRVVVPTEKTSSRQKDHQSIKFILRIPIYFLFLHYVQLFVFINFKFTCFEVLEYAGNPFGQLHFFPQRFLV